MGTLGYSDTPLIPGSTYHVHDGDRPQPRVVTPGATAGAAPSDAVVLFDGTCLCGWVSCRDGSPAPWTLGNGFMEVKPGTGNIRTKAAFGNCQLHLEFASPSVVKGESQGRGNSGVFLMGRYEIQVLDCYQNPTYPDGTTGGIYGQFPPLVNACRKPGEWQCYDIVFHRPVFGQDGKVVKRATFTVFHNGVLIQDHYDLSGGNGWLGPHAVTDYVAHGDKGPIMLQDHGNPVRFRNIWLRELAD